MVSGIQQKPINKNYYINVYWDLIITHLRVRCPLYYYLCVSPIFLQSRKVLERRIQVSYPIPIQTALGTYVPVYIDYRQF